MKRIIPLLLIIATFFASAVFAAKPEASLGKIRIAYAGGACEAPVFVAYHNGFFKAEGLEPEILQAEFDALRTGVSSGKIDASVGNFGWFKAIEQGFKVKITGGIHAGCIKFVVPKDSPIKSLADLKGKTIGIDEIGQCRASSATGARRCRFGSAKRPAIRRPSAATTELLAKPGVDRHGRLAKGEAGESRFARRSVRSQAVHRRGDLRFAEGHGARMRRVSEVIDCWFDSGAMPFAQWGYPNQPGSAEQFRTSFPPISSARRSTRPAAGFTVCWRSARCCLERRRRAEGSRQWAVRGRTKLSKSPQSPIPNLHPIPSRLPFPASLPQLHRAGADAGRGRREDVEEQAELPRAERDFRPLRGRRPALVLLRQPAAVDLDPLQRAVDQGLHSRVPAAAVERLQFLCDLREDRRFRSRRLAHRRAGVSPGQTRAGRAWPRRRAIGRWPSAASWTAGFSAN